MEFRDLKTKQIEAEAFQAGTQGVEATAQLSELEAGFSGLKQRVIQESTDRVKRLEALIANLKRRLEEAQDHWSDLQMRSDGMPPPVMLPLVVVALALLVVTGEAVFLAPVTDALGIADPTAQLIFAAVIVVVTSGLVEIAKLQLMSHAEPTDQQAGTGVAPAGRFARCLKIVLLVLLSALSLTLVFFLGSWRAEQMIFAASLQHSGAWKRFMSDNPELTRAVVVLLTTGLPVFVAVVFDWGLSGLRFAWEWRKARHQCHSFARQLDRAQKRLEAEEVSRDSRLAELDEKCKEWKSSYEHHHALGKQIGARRLPLWRVLLKIAAVVCVIGTACFILDPFVSGYVDSERARLLLYALLTLGLGGLYAAHAVRAWERPNAKQIFKQRATIWRESLPDAAPARVQGSAAVVVPKSLGANGAMPSRAQASSEARA
ncbi:MAG: hypothetical protein M3444_02980 [Acidobacteriota bacterium]|nr:hypothetical protein [Acidobacteriota bacterium]MDQ5835242.1 hypothetical protein [Acidobacteriota bacterium]